jgi:hypothetical protein
MGWRLIGGPLKKLFRWEKPQNSKPQPLAIINGGGGQMTSGKGNNVNKSQPTDGSLVVIRKQGTNVVCRGFFPLAVDFVDIRQNFDGRIHVLS